MNRNEEGRTCPPHWERGFRDRYRLLDKLIRWRDLSAAVSVGKRGRQPLNVMVIVLVIHHGVRPRLLMRLEMPMDQVRTVPVMDLCDVDVLRRQEA